MKIDRLSLELPAGLQGRADTLARLVADRLAAASWGGPRRIGRLAPPPVAWEPGMTDHALAGRISSAIVAAAADGGDS